MSGINACRHRKTNRRLEFPYFYTSHSIHVINKLRTAAKNNYEPTYRRKLKNDDIQKRPLNWTKLFCLIVYPTIRLSLALRTCCDSLLFYYPTRCIGNIPKLVPWFISLTSSIPTSALYTKQSTQHFYQYSKIHEYSHRI